MRKIALIAFLLAASSAFAQTPLNPSVTETVPPTASPVGVNGLPDSSLSSSVTTAAALLGPGDTLEVSVMGAPELTQRVRVNDEGKVALDLIGTLEVRGKSLEWLRREISDELVAGNFVKHPQVNAFVTEYAGQFVYVTGEVNRPGAYALLRTHHLSDMIAAAGGYTSRAGTQVTITRGGEGKQSIKVSLNGPEESVDNPEVEPGDTVNVGLAGVVYVLGNVTKPGGFLMDRRNTLTFVKALALAEGPTATASLTKAVLIHSADPQAQPVPVNLRQVLKNPGEDIVLHSGDIIWVADSTFRNFGRLAIETILSTASGVAIYSSYTH